MGQLKNITVLSAAELKEKSRNFDESVSENDRIRIHRAISWLKCAETQNENPDLKFISLWIAFNACYADSELHNVSLTERKRFNDFISKLVKHDQEELIFAREKFPLQVDSLPIRAPPF